MRDFEVSGSIHLTFALLAVLHIICCHFSSVNSIFFLDQKVEMSQRLDVISGVITKFSDKNLCLTVILKCQFRLSEYFYSYVIQI
jgi:hypothetical protein